MNKIFKVAATKACVATLTGCIDPANYVTTQNGTMVCQLYKLNNILWDEAISVPPGMSIKTGDTICKNKGHVVIESKKTRSFWNVVNTKSYPLAAAATRPDGHVPQPLIDRQHMVIK